MKINLNDLLYKFTGQGKPDPDAVHNKSIKSKKITIKPRFFIIAFAVIVVIIAIGSIGILKDNKELSTNVGADVSPSDINENAGTINESILIGYSYSDSTDLKFLGTVSINSEDNSVAFRYIPLSEFVTIDSISGTFRSQYEQGGITRLTTAVSEKYGTKCSKHIFTNNDGLYNVFKYGGSLEFTVDKTFDYDYNGISITFDKGSKINTPDLILKYFCFLSDNIESNEEEMAELISAVANNLFDTENNEALLEKYNKLINSLSTNISASDIQNSCSTLNNIFLSDGIENMTFAKYENQ